MKRWRFAVFSLVVLALAGSMLQADPQQQTPTEFPDLTLFPLSDEEPVQLASFRGRPVLLSFWASWCGPCRWELPEFEELYGELSQRGFVLVTVNVDRSALAADMFIARTGLGVPVYRLDPDELYQLGVNSLPTNILLDPAGKVALSTQGYTSTLSETIRKRVVAMLDELEQASGQGEQT